MAQRLPVVSGDTNTWGTVLNDYLLVAHNQYGGAYTINSVNSATITSYNIGTTETGSIGGSNAPVANEYFLVNCTTASVTITLPDYTNANFSYMVYNVKKTDSSSHTVTINTTSSQTIDGGSSVVLKVPYVSVQIVTDGSSGWFVI